MNKLSKTAKTIDTIAKVIFWLTIVVGIIAMLGLFIVKTDDFNQISLGNVNLTLSESYMATIQPSVIPRALMPLTILITMGCGCYSIWILRKILAPMINQTPFEESVSMNLRKLGWFTLISGTILQILEIAYQTLLFSNYRVEEFFNPANISDIMLNFQLDITFVYASVALFVLAFIFRYGEELQKLSDETL